MPEALVAYASCWEDIDYAVAQGSSGPYERVLSIASGGDNSLVLLPLATRELVAVDLDAGQLHLLRLKAACIRHLARERALAFLGVRESRDRSLTYRDLRRRLDAETRRFWDAHAGYVDRGVLNAGKLDRYFARFARYVMPLIHDRGLARELLREKSAVEQDRLFRERWDTPRWRALFRVFFSARVMSLLGRDPAKFRHVEASLAEELLAQSAAHLGSPAAQGNGFLHYLLVGGFGPYLPAYLRPGRYEAVREHLHKLRTFHGPAEAAPGGGFDLLNLSNVFEYMDEETFARVGRGLHARAAPGAECCYWNMMVPRDLSEALPEQFERVVAQERGRADWGFFYRAFHLDRVRNETA